MPEYARVCQSMPEYARVCKSMPEYARVILPLFVNFLIKFWSILLEQKSSGQIVLFAVDDICTHCPELIFPGQELENSGFPKLPDLRRPQTRFLTFPINLAASSNPPLPINHKVPTHQNKRPKWTDVALKKQILQKQIAFKQQRPKCWNNLKLSRQYKGLAS